MKKIMIIAGLFSLAILASCNHDKASTTQTEQPEAPAQVAVEQEEEAEVVSLTAYSDDLLGQAENTVLFFHSASCGSCRATEKSLLETGTSDDLQVLKVNFDEDSELRKKYEIPKYHHFVQVDANGDLIKKWSGSFNLEDIQAQLVDTDVEESAADEVAQVADIETEAEAPVALAGSYQAYDSSLLGSTDNTVLFFHASWCPPCKAADASINETGVSDNLTILKVDFDNSAELRKKYGVTSQHTFVQVDADGNLIKKWSGGSSAADIESKLK